MLSSVDKIYTTTIGAERLSANSVTGTPCRHGPIDGDRGPVTGFVLNFKDETQGAVYITGDTVWYEGVEEVAKRFDVKLIVLFMEPQ